jgi:hypothetical protein
MLVCDDEVVAIQRGTRGDHRFTFGQRAVFHVADDQSRILCAPRNLDEPHWVRFLLDTVFHSTSVLSGFEALHGAGVSHQGRAIAIVADSGGGKSTLAAHLIGRGMGLVSDDILPLETVDGMVMARPGPRTANLARNLWGSVITAEQASLIAGLGEECWVAFADQGPEPLPLAAVCVLDRRPGLEPRLRPFSPTVLDLMRFSLPPVGGPVAGRERLRFELLSTVATSVPMYRLEASLTTPAAELAALVFECVSVDRQVPETV